MLFVTLVSILHRLFGHVVVLFPRVDIILMEPAQLTVNSQRQSRVVRADYFRVLFIANAQYTPLTPTRLSCRVGSRRRCVLNSQLVHDDCRRVRSHRRHDATDFAVDKFVHADSSRLSAISCEFRTHRRCDSTRQLSRVGVGGVYWT